MIGEMVIGAIVVGTVGLIVASLVKSGKKITPTLVEKDIQYPVYSYGYSNSVANKVAQSPKPVRTKVRTASRKPKAFDPVDVDGLAMASLIVSDEANRPPSYDHSSSYSHDGSSSSSYDSGSSSSSYDSGSSSSSFDSGSSS